MTSPSTTLARSMCIQCYAVCMPILVSVSITAQCVAAGRTPCFSAVQFVHTFSSLSFSIPNLPCSAIFVSVLLCYEMAWPRSVRFATALKQSDMNQHRHHSQCCNKIAIHVIEIGKFNLLHWPGGAHKKDLSIDVKISRLGHRLCEATFFQLRRSKSVKIEYRIFSLLFIDHMSNSSKITALSPTTTSKPGSAAAASDTIDNAKIKIQNKRKFHQTSSASVTKWLGRGAYASRQP